MLEQKKNFCGKISIPNRSTTMKNNDDSLKNVARRVK
jgi:hypothetical protein